MTSWLISKIKWIVGLFLGISVAVAAPTIPTPMVWVVSYETVAFDTIDGDLEMNQYAYNGEDGEGNTEWYIRTEPKGQANFITTVNPSDIVGKREVGIRAEKSGSNPDCTGCAYYDEFRNRAGQIIRISSTQNTYHTRRVTKDYPQPNRIELIAPLTAIETNAAPTHDASASSTFTHGSSISWSHTVVSATNGAVSVAAVIEDETSGAWSTTESTFNGTAMTRVTHEVLDAGANDVNSAQYILATAGEGTGSKTITIVNAQTNSMLGASETYTSVDQTTPYDGEQSGSQDNENPPSLTMTSAVGDLVVGFGSRENGITNFNDSTVRQQDITWQADHELWTADETGATSVTFSYTRTDTGINASAIHAVNMNVASGAPPAAAPPPIPQAIIIQ
jgi:hypothetical protein